VKTKDRVRMHRDKRRAENFSRLDIWIDGRLLADLRTLQRIGIYRFATLPKRHFEMWLGDGPTYSPSSKANAVVHRLPDMGGRYDDV
jgi:hypothetical protein